MTNEKLIHVKLEYPEAVESKRDFLNSEIYLLKCSHSIQKYRILRSKGKIFHYTGDPGIKRGLDIRQGIAKKMAKAGFSNIKRVFNGLVAEKS